MTKCPRCGAKVKVSGHVADDYEAVMDEGLITALKDIIKYLEINTPTRYHLSATYMIAKKALEEHENGK